MKQGKALHKHVQRYTRDDSIKQRDANIGSILWNYASDNNQIPYLCCGNRIQGEKLGKNFLMIKK